MKYKDEILNKLHNSIKRAKSVLYSAKRNSILNNEEIIYWPLFFSDDTVPFENEVIDTCAISVGLIAFIELISDNIGTDEKLIIDKSVTAILGMRNENGSWPSFVFPSKNNKIFLEGIINDTSFALNALVKIGFLSEKPIIDENILKTYNLTSFQDRVDYLFESISWLKTNRVNKAWYYTGIENFENTESVLPATSSTISVINTLLSIYKSLILCTDIKQSFIKDIEILLDDSIGELLIAQSENGGFSKHRGDIESIAHTCNAICCLLSHYEHARYSSNILTAIKWLLKKRDIAKPNKIKSSDYFDEYAQILSSDKIVFKKRNIHHESFIDALIFCSLQFISNSPYLKNLNFFERFMLSHFITKSLKNLLSRQSNSGNYLGAFKSRRHVPSEEYPIYGIQQSVLGLILANNHPNMFKKIISFKKNTILTSVIVIVTTFIISLLIFYKFSTMELKDSLLFSFLLSVLASLLATIFFEIWKKFYSINVT